MKKIVALLLALLSVLMCFASCSNTPDMTDTAVTNTDQPSYPKPTSVEDSFLGSEIDIIYNGFYYYSGDIDTDKLNSESTIKVQNLRNLLPNGGVQLYGDPLGNEDPFRQKMPNLQMLVDEEATKENGGMPVLIIGISYDRVDLEGDNRILVYRLISYNTASGKLTTLAEEVEELKRFYLYKDKIYCVARSWDYTNSDDPDRIYSVLVMEKDGKNKKEYVLEEKNVCPYLIGIYNNKLYFSQNHNILRSDLDFENEELLFDDIECYFTPVFASGYMYYLSPKEIVNVDSFDFKSYKLFRRPLSDLLNNKSEEVVLEGFYYISQCHQTNLYQYYKISDAQIIDKSGKKTLSYSCAYIFNIDTASSEILYDYRKENTNNGFYLATFVTDEIFLILKDRKKLVINRNTGEEIDATGIFD